MIPTVKKKFFLNANVIYNNLEQSFYPGITEMIFDLEHAGYQVSICYSAEIPERHLMATLVQNNLRHISLHSILLSDISNFDEFLLRESVKPSVKANECYFLTVPSEFSRLNADQGVKILHLEIIAEQSYIQAVNNFRETLVTNKILPENLAIFPEGFNRGIYPSTVGLLDNKIIIFQPQKSEYQTIDTVNNDFNFKKRCLYQSRLAQLIVEQGRSYWIESLRKINQLFLDDFKLKTQAKPLPINHPYLEKIIKVLTNKKLLEKDRDYTPPVIYQKLSDFFKDDSDLTEIFDFYFFFWTTGRYDPESMEPFVFSINGLQRQHQPSAPHPSTINDFILLRHFPDIGVNPVSRIKAYFFTHPWSLFSKPNLAGRLPRTPPVTPPFSNTIGILCDDDAEASMLTTKPHFSSKMQFSIDRTYPSTHKIQQDGGALIAGVRG